MSKTMSTIIEIRPGNGGEDAELFAYELQCAVERALTSNKSSFLSEAMSEKDKGWVIRTEQPAHSLSHLQGKHVIQRIPSNSKARHTSSVIIVVMEEDSTPNESLILKDKDVKVDRYRGHGAGGQHRNKVSTAIRLTHAPTGIMIVRESGRSQSANLISAQRQLQRELDSRQADDYKSRVNNQREGAGDENRKTYTYNMQRGVVTSHISKDKHNMKRWMEGVGLVR